jgi:hypothetical protein
MKENCSAQVTRSSWIKLGKRVQLGRTARVFTTPEYNTGMVWLYEKQDSSLRIETRFDSATNEYVLEVTWPGRSPETERFTSIDAFRSRVLVLEQQLDAARWMQVGSPEILPHGWRGPIAH